VRLGVDGPRQLLPGTLQNVLTAVVSDELAAAVETVSLGAAVFVDDPRGELTIARRAAHASWCPKDRDLAVGDPPHRAQSVVSNVVVSSAVELPPTQTSKVELSRTQFRAAVLQ
jgi:hypothetical protein